MDPAPIINTAPNTVSFHPPEIWQFPPSTTPQFEHGFGAFATEVPGSELVGSDLRVLNRGRKRRDTEEDSGKGVSTSNDVNDDDGSGGKRIKTSGKSKDEETVVGEENSSGKHAEKITDEPHPKQDYIHVRARRGQATDSHSLAERVFSYSFILPNYLCSTDTSLKRPVRVCSNAYTKTTPTLVITFNFFNFFKLLQARREKISERMKTLQDLVPGCNKVIGKALVLDEIINYIQSLHHQVEFLSMKLEAVNSRLTPGIEMFPPKAFDQQTFDTTPIPFASQSTREYSRGSSPEWLHMQVGGGFERST